MAKQKKHISKKATTKKKKPIEHKIKIFKEAGDEVVGAITLKKATFAYTFSHLDNYFAGVDVVVFYEEIDDFDKPDSDLQKNVTKFEVDGGSLTANLPLLRNNIEELMDNISSKNENMDDKERIYIVDRIMHNVKHFIFSNEMTLEGEL